MAKINRKVFTAGYAKEEGGIKESAADKVEALKKIDDEETRLKDKYRARVKEIPYEDIIPNPINRDATKGIEGLAASIQSLGLIHYLRVVEQEDGKYMITSGERRWRAIGQIRKEHPEAFKVVPCTYVPKNTDPLDEEARLYVANNEKNDPTPEEYRKSVERLYDIYEKKKARGDEVPAAITAMIADELNLTQRQVQKVVSVNRKLIPELQEVYDKKGITLDKASNIAQLDPIYQEEILDLISTKGNINNADISYYKAEDEKLRSENAAQKEELDRLRGELQTLLAAHIESTSQPEDIGGVADSEKSIDNEGARSSEEEYLERIAYLENTIEGLTKVIKGSSKPNDDSEDMANHMAFQDVIARIERAQKNVMKQAKDITLNDIERKRLESIIENLSALLK